MEGVTGERQRREHDVLSVETWSTGARERTKAGRPPPRTKAPLCLTAELRQGTSRPTRLQGSSSSAPHHSSTGSLILALLILHRGVCPGEVVTPGPPAAPSLQGPPSLWVLSRGLLPAGSELAQTFTNSAVSPLPSVHTAGRDPGHTCPGRLPHQKEGNTRPFDDKGTEMQPTDAHCAGSVESPAEPQGSGLGQLRLPLGSCCPSRVCRPQIQLQVRHTQAGGEARARVQMAFPTGPCPTTCKTNSDVLLILATALVLLSRALREFKTGTGR